MTLVYSLEATHGTRELKRASHRKGTARILFPIAFVQTALIVVLAAIDNSIIAAIIGGCFLTVNSILTLFLASRIERKERQRNSRPWLEDGIAEKEDSSTTSTYRHNGGSSAHHKPD